jgi:hypothetical protein
MPRISLRKQVLTELEHLSKRRRIQATIRSLFSNDALLDEDDDDNDIFSVHTIVDKVVENVKQSILSRRYLFPRKPYRKGYSKMIFERDLREDDDADGTPPWLTDDEFLHKYRMHRSSFYRLLALIEKHPAFVSKGRKKQAPVKYQLLLFLFYIGKSGSGANFETCRQMFGVSKGTCNNYRKRVAAAIRSLRDEFITWPDKKERKKIARRVMEKFDFINCIALADGTLFPLTYEPQSRDAPDYHGRKFQYSMTTMIVCDDERFIRYYLAGFPGCVHDNRVYKNTELYRDPEKFFGRSYFLLSDSALSNSPTVVSSFKCATGHSLPPDRERFNKVLAKPRVISEHTIGMLKGRFQFLKSMPMKITDQKKKRRKRYSELLIVVS